MAKKGDQRGSEQCQKNGMASGPVGGPRYMSCGSGENGNVQKAKGTDVCFMSDSTGMGTVFPITCSCHWQGRASGQRQCGGGSW